MSELNFSKCKYFTSFLTGCRSKQLLSILLYFVDVAVTDTKSDFLYWFLALILVGFFLHTKHALAGLAHINLSGFRCRTSRLDVSSTVKSDVAEFFHLYAVSDWFRLNFMNLIPF